MTTKVHSVFNSKSCAINPYMESREKTHALVFFDAFFVVHFVAKQYVLQQKCLNRQIGTCLLGTH